MAVAFKAEAIIEKSPGEVWAMLTDWGRAPEWMKGIDSLRAEGTAQAGTELKFVARGAERTSTVHQWDPEKQLTLRSVQGGITADYTYHLQELDPGRTRISLQATCDASGFFWTVLSPLIRMGMKMTDGGQLRDLKALFPDG